MMAAGNLFGALVALALLALPPQLDALALAAQGSPLEDASWTRLTFLQRDYFVLGTHPTSRDSGTVKLALQFAPSYVSNLNCNGTSTAFGCIQVRQSGYGVLRVAEETTLAVTTTVAITIIDPNHVRLDFAPQPPQEQQRQQEQEQGPDGAADLHSSAVVTASNPAASLSVSCAMGVRSDPAITWQGYNGAGTLLVSLAHECACAATTYATCNTTYTAPEHPLTRFIETNFGARCEKCGDMDSWFTANFLVITLVMVGVLWTSNLWVNYNMGKGLARPWRSHLHCFFLGWIEGLNPVLDLVRHDRSSFVTSTLFVPIAMGCISIFMNFILILGTKKLGGRQIGGGNEGFVIAVILIVLPILAGSQASIPSLGAFIGLVYSLLGSFWILSIINCYARLGAYLWAVLYFPAGICFLSVASIFLFMLVRSIRRFMQGHPAHGSRQSPHHHRLDPSWKRLAMPRGMGVDSARLSDRTLYVVELLRAVTDYDILTGRRRKKNNATSKCSIFRRIFPSEASLAEFSPRLLCVSVLGLSVMAGLASLFAFGSEALAIFMEATLSGGRCCGHSNCNTDPAAQRWIDMPLPIDVLTGAVVVLDIGGSCDSTHGVIRDAIRWVFTTSGIVSAVIAQLYIFHTTFKHQSSLRRLYAGDKSFLGELSPPGAISSITSTLKYASAQLVYLFVGWAFGTFFLCIFFLFITFTVVLPIIGIYPDVFWIDVYHFLIYGTNGQLGWLSIMMINYVALYVAVALVFQIRGGSVGIRNYALWGLVDLFQFLFYTLNGFASFIGRLVTVMICSITFLPRLDKSLTPRGQEFMDPGYTTYVGFLFMEAYYTNPVMLTFCRTLLLDLEEKYLYFHHTSGHHSHGNSHSGGGASDSDRGYQRQHQLEDRSSSPSPRPYSSSFVAPPPPPPPPPPPALAYDIRHGGADGDDRSRSIHTEFDDDAPLLDPMSSMNGHYGATTLNYNTPMDDAEANGDLRLPAIPLQLSQQQRIARNKWFVAYTLLNNPHLILVRKRHLAAVKAAGKAGAMSALISKSSTLQTLYLRAMRFGRLALGDEASGGAEFSGEQAGFRSATGDTFAINQDYSYEHEEDDGEQDMKQSGRYSPVGTGKQQSRSGFVRGQSGAGLPSPPPPPPPLPLFPSSSSKNSKSK